METSSRLPLRRSEDQTASKINIRPCVSFTPHTLCEINNKEVRPNSALCLQFVFLSRGKGGGEWGRHSASCYSSSNVFSSWPAVWGLSVHFTVFVWITGQHVHERCSIFTLRLCVWMRVERPGDDDGQSAAAQGALPSALSPSSLLWQTPGSLRDSTRGCRAYLTGGGGGGGGGTAVPAGPASRAWPSHRFRTPDEKAYWWKCRRDRPTLSAEAKPVHRLDGRSEEPSSAHEMTFLIQHSLRVKELTYLRFTSFVAVIVQVEILHVQEIFDVTLSVASSPCATWSREAQKTSFLLSLILLVRIKRPPPTAI